ncbi:MAG: hypothetical protein COC24_003100 [Alphaproteobacteria bacterium]|nr:hypothetical protein [Alphaproteobacteria bacterium]
MNTNLNNPNLHAENLTKFISTVFNEQFVDGVLYSTNKGTAIKVKYKNSHFIVSAKHVVLNENQLHNWKPENIRLPVSLKAPSGPKEAFPFTEVIYPNGIKVNKLIDEELSDIIIFVLDNSIAQKYSHHFFDLKNINTELNWECGFLIGLPTAGQTTDNLVNSQTFGVLFEEVECSIKN